MSTTILKDTKQQSLLIPSDKVQFPEDLILADYIEEVAETLSNIPIFEFNEETGELNIIFAGSLIETKLDYFWIENLEDEEGEVVFSLKGSTNDKPVTLEYSIDRGESWTEFNTSSLTSSNTSLSIAIPAKTTMYLRGNNECFGVSLGLYTKISCSKQYNIGGNLVSLLNKNLVEPETLPNYCFEFLFNGNTNLVDASKLIMPSKTSNYCYYNMFNCCTSLTTAPELPVTTLANYCYEYMFEGCTSLTTAPELPATTLASSCYSGMFSGCTSLTTAPELFATTLTSGCYEYMFRGCTNLNYVKAMFTSIGTSSLTNWLSGTASIGTFVKNPAANWTASDLGLPDGWTIVDAA